MEPLLDPALRRDYILTNARGVFGPLMSEFVFGYLLLHERKILQRLEAQKEHRWDPTLTGTLRGKTIGLLGVGSIGAELARTAKFFGMSVRGFTRASESCSDVDEYFHADLPAFVSGLDYFVSVLPNTAETRHIIDAQVLNALPKHAIFVNVGRGSAVDESALVEALATGAIAGSVLDVFEQEPLPAGASALVSAEYVHHQSHLRTEFSRRYCSAVHRKLPTVYRRPTAEIRSEF